LAGLSARPVVFTDPPAFVERYAAEIDHSESPSLPKEPKTDNGNVESSTFAKMTVDLSNEEAFVLNVILDGNSLDVLLRLFTHQDKAQRVKIASAFAAVNAKFSHHEESGFADKRKQFWLDVAEHLPDMQNALSEALIASAKEGTTNQIPYTLAWMPGQGRETLELFAWAAKHHPVSWVRRSSIYYVVKLGGDEELADPLLQNRSYDPDYKVRKEALDLRFKRFTGEL